MSSNFWTSVKAYIKPQKLVDFEKIFGTVRGNPDLLAEYDLSKVRGTGRTFEMIMAFPNEGPYVVVAHKKDWANQIKRQTEEIRGKTVADNGKFISNDQMFIAGTSGPIFIDNAITDMLVLNYIRFVQKTRMLKY